MDALEPARALEAAWQLLSTINVYLQEKQPWNLAKTGDEGRAELETVLYAALEGLRIASILAEPFMPAIAAALRKQLGAEDLPLDLLQATRWGGLPAGTRLGDAKPLFPRVDIKAYLKEIEVENETRAAAEAAAGEDLISIDDFASVKLKVGLIKQAERVPKSKKLMKIMVDVGEGEPRQLVAGIAERYEAEALVGRRIVVVANLQPAKLMGVESRGMLLAASVDGEPFLLSVNDEVPPGTGVR
jgi:methionyl-tRNA synthetase